MYSDESTFHCIRFIKTRVRRAKGLDWFDSRFMSVTVKHLDTVMVRGCFSGAVGQGGLYFLPKNCTMKGERDQEVLAKDLIPFMAIHAWHHSLSAGNLRAD
jgi:hypothetical protein